MPKKNIFFLVLCLVIFSGSVYGESPLPSNGPIQKTEEEVENTDQVQTTPTAPYSSENIIDAKQVLTALKEIRFNVEAGVTFVEYRNVVSKASVEYRKYIDKYPEAGKGNYPSFMLSMTLGPYQDAHKIWYNAIYEREKAPDVEECDWLLAKWPALKTKIPERYMRDRKGNDTGRPWYWYEDIMKALWNLAAAQESIVDESLN